MNNFSMKSIRKNLHSRALISSSTFENLSNYIFSRKYSAELIRLMINVFLKQEKSRQQIIFTFRDLLFFVPGTSSSLANLFKIIYLNWEFSLTSSEVSQKLGFRITKSILFFSLNILRCYLHITLSFNSNNLRLVTGSEKSLTYRY